MPAAGLLQSNKHGETDFGVREDPFHITSGVLEDTAAAAALTYSFSL